ncbi:MAG: hypothetical protein H6818_09025 [Phycisphaerales bacterium]|nr:hypothetical protein [Phycisphaerales bacterium]MCB9862712.1 hypothetical protein [Phycisphaerales bacterium]
MWVWIWGWSYYFIRNAHFVHGTCSQCRQYRPLLCYDAIQFFTFCFVPLFPVERHRITQECPQCEVGTRVSYSKYRRFLTKEVEPAISDACDRPSDKEAAKRALAMCLDVCYMDGFRRTADSVARGGSISDADVAHLIAVGYEMLGEQEGAERVLLAALSKNDSGDIRRRLVHYYVAKGSPRKAIPHLLRLIELEGNSALGFVFARIDDLQSLGRHRDVVALVDDIRERFPDIKSDVLMRLRNDSSQIPDVARPTTTERATFPMRLPGRRIVPAVIVPFLLLLVFSAYLGFCLLSKPENTYLVNGLDTPYDVLVNGTAVTLPPRVEIPMQARFGDNLIEAGPGAPPFEPIHLSIQSRFFSRPFEDSVRIVNPDCLAAVVWEDVTYVENPPSTPNDNRNFYTGLDHYKFSRVDYVFADPPTSITATAGGFGRRYSHIYVERKMSHAQIASFLQATRLPEDSIRYLRKLLPLEPSYEALALASEVLPQEEFGPLLKHMTGRRPILIQAHRFWQSWIEIHQPGVDLDAVYRPLLRDEPGNRDLAYVAACVARTIDERRLLLEQSIREPNASAYGYYGLAYLDLCIGDFDKALSNAVKAVAQLKDDFDVRDVYEFALLADGKLKELETILLERAFGAEFDLDAAITAVRLIARHDRTAAERKAKEVELVASSQWGIPTNHPTIVRNAYWCKIAILEGAGDRDGLLEMLESSEDVNQRMRRALIRSDLDSIQQLLRESTGQLRIPSSMISRLTYVIARRRGNREIADRCLIALLEDYNAGDASARRIATWLEGDTAPSAIAVAADESPGADVAATLCMFAERFPERSREYIALARKHEFMLTFPRFVLDGLLESP